MLTTSTVQLDTNHPVRVFPNEDSVIVTLAGVGAYYAQGQVSASSNDGSLSNGQSLTVLSPTAFLASGPGVLTVSRAAGGALGGAPFPPVGVDGMRPVYDAAGRSWRALGDGLVGQALLRKLYDAQGGVILWVGDSTSDATDEIAGLMADSLGGLLPLVRVEYVAWSDGGSSWPATTVRQAGDGSHGTLTVYNCSVGGKEPHYFLAPYFDAMIAAVQPDLVFINLGHNENTAAADPFWHDDLLALGETITAYCPRAEVVVTTQNPRTDSSASASAQRRAMTSRIAKMRGWGCIDTYRRFVLPDGSVDTSLMTDGTHPNASGEALMWDEIQRHFTYVPGVSPTHQAESSLLRPTTTALLNADFSQFAAPPTLTSWTATQATLSRDATNFQGPNGYSVRAVAASAATSYFEQGITGSAVRPYLGELCTFVAWVRRPSGANANVGRVHMRTTGGSNTFSLNSFSTTQGQGDFIPVSVSGRVDKTAGTVTCRIYVENGSTGTGDISVDRCWFGKGPLPRDLR